MLLGATGSDVVVILPADVIFTIDSNLNCEITSCNSSHIPFNTSDLATLVNCADSNGEEKRDECGNGTNEAHLLVLFFKLFLRLDASVLYKHTGIEGCGIALRSNDTVGVEVFIFAKLKVVCGTTDSLLHVAKESNTCRLTVLDVIVISTVASSLIRQVETVVIDLSDGSVRAL